MSLQLKKRTMKSLLHAEQGELQLRQLNDDMPEEEELYKPDWVTAKMPT